MLDWQVSAAGKAAVKPTWTYSRRPAKRVTEPSTKLIAPGRYLLRNPKEVIYTQILINFPIDHRSYALRRNASRDALRHL